MACISHLTIFVSTIGLLVAIGLWIYLRERQPYAAFQAAQAVLFQLIVMVLTFVVVFFLMIVFFGVFGIGLAAASDTGEAVFGVFAAILIFIFVAIVGVLTLALYGYAIYAAVRSYQGRPFRIPGIASIAASFSPMPSVHGQERTT